MGFVVALISTGACGKKGPPLAPLVRVPAAVDKISARRVGQDVYVTLTIPSANLDEFTPADINRVQVFGYTGRTAPSRPRWTELGTLITEVPVAPPVPTERAPQAPAQGAQITIVDRLTPDELVQGKLPVVEPRTPTLEPGTSTPTQNPERRTRNVEVAPLRRFYTAVPFSPRGRPGPPGTVAEFTLLPVPDPPPSIDATYTDRELLLTWEPSGGLIGFLLERTLPEEPLPVEAEGEIEQEEAAEATEAKEAEQPAAPPTDTGPVMYNVYRTAIDDPFAPPPDTGTAGAWFEQPPSPVNAEPVAALAFADSLEFNRRRCYTVRAVRGTGPDARVGEASPAVCVTPVDTFAPAPPEGLATVSSAGAVSLIWQPNTELDLAGYLVLRGAAGDDTLQPLTLTPIMEARYRDTDVTPGTRYVYAVVAVDNRFPVPNVSELSQAVEETAR